MNKVLVEVYLFPTTYQYLWVLTKTNNFCSISKLVCILFYSGKSQSISSIRTYGESSDSETNLETYGIQHLVPVTKTSLVEGGLGASSAQSSPRVIRRASNSSSSSLARANRQKKRRSMSMDSLLADMSVPVLAGAANMSEKVCYPSINLMRKHLTNV